MKKLFLIIVIGFMAMIVVAEDVVVGPEEQDPNADKVAGAQSLTIEDCNEKINVTTNRLPGGKDPVGDLIQPSGADSVQGNK